MSTTQAVKTLEMHAQEVLTQGYTIVENVLDRAMIDEATTALDAVFEQEKEIAPSRGWQTDVFRISYMLPQKHAFFRSFPRRTPILPLMRRLLGEDCLSASLNGLSMTCGGQTQKLHIDQAQTIPHNVIYIHALHTLDEFTVANGATRVVPFSQNRPLDYRRYRENPEEFERETIYLEAPPGSVIAYNGGLWHAGSQNHTDRPRRCLLAYFCRSWVRPDWDFPNCLSPDVIAQLTPEEKRLFGFHSRANQYDWKNNEVIRMRD